MLCNWKKSLKEGLSKQPAETPAETEDHYVTIAPQEQGLYKQPAKKPDHTVKISPQAQDFHTLTYLIRCALSVGKHIQQLNSIMEENILMCLQRLV